MLRTSVQTVINIIVVLLVIGALAMGAASFLPAKNPAGPLIGKALSAKHILSGMIENLDPAALGEALRNNPNMLSDLIAEMGDDGATDLATAINENPAFITAVVHEIDPETIAYVMNSPESAEFTVNLVNNLNPAAIASIVNASGDFASALVGELDPQVIANVVNANGDFLAASTAAMDPAVIAQVVNDNGPFLASLTSFLDPIVIAGALNANPNTVSNLMGFLDTGVVAGAVNANGDFLAGLLGQLDPAVLAQGTNSHPTFMTRLIGNLNPSVVASALNANSDTNVVLLQNISNEVLAAALSQTANNPAFINALIPKLSPSVLAQMVNVSAPFTQGLLKALDPAWVAGVANQNPSLVFQVEDQISPDLVATMLNNESVQIKVLPLINTAAIGAALGEHTDFVTRLIPLLDPALAEVTNRALGGNPGLAAALIANLDGAKIAGALAQAPQFLKGVIAGTSPSMVAAILRGSKSNPQFLINLTNALDAASIARALDLSGAFLPGLLAVLPSNIAVTVGNSLNARPEIIDTVLKTSDPKVIAGILNSGAADNLLAAIVPLLDDATAQAIANGINADAGQSATDSMLKGLINNTNPDAMADAINRNPGFISGVLANLNENAARAIAAGLNARPDVSRVVSATLSAETGAAIGSAISQNTAILKPLIGNLSPQVGRAIAEGLNQNTSDLNYQLMANLNDDVARAIAQGLNAAVTDAAGNYKPDNFLAALLPNLNSDTGKEIAAGLNANSADVNAGFLTAILSASTVKLSNAITQVINSSSNMDTLISGLLANLDPTTAKKVADGLNANPDFVDYLIRNLDGAKAAQQLNKNTAWTQTLVQNLDANSLGTALNTALASAGGKKFLTDLLNTLDGAIIGRALNNNQQLTKDLLTTAGNIGLGTKLKALLSDVANKWPAQHQPLASTSPSWKPVGFLSELFNNLDAQIVVNAFNNSMTFQDNPDLPYLAPDGHRYTLLQVLWLKVDSIIQIGSILGSLPLWQHIKAAEYVNP
jgi:hypothetical protein